MTGSHSLSRAGASLCASFLLASAAGAQLDPDGKVLSFFRITSLTGGFGEVLLPGDRFGDSTTGIGDLDGNGVPDLAVGAPGDDDGGLSRGAVWILFLAPGGTVLDEQKISDTAGGFGGVLVNGDSFGTAVDDAGDLDGDGRNELVVGTVGEKLFVLFLDSDGTVLAEQEISSGTGGFGGALSAGDGFGSAVGAVGDVDGDGIPDLAVGAPGDDDGGANRGAAWILFLDTDGTVLSEQKVSSTAGGFGAGLANGDALGTSVEGLEDLDGDGVPELAVGAPLTNGTDFIVVGPGQPPIPIAAPDEGVMFVLFLEDDGTVTSKVEIGQGLAGFPGMPMAGHRFGAELTATGDLDGNGVRDVAVGLEMFATVVGPAGAFYELFLDTDGTVSGARLVTDKRSGFTSGFGSVLLLPDDRFAAAAYVGDVNADCKGDMVCGAAGDDFAGTDVGAVWMLRLEGELQAMATFRNGSGGNPAVYGSTSDPRLGRSWTAEVDVSGHPGATISALIGQDGPLSLPIGLGELLVDVTGENIFVDSVTPVGGVASHSIALPFDTSLEGFQIFTQGVIGGGAGPELTNAIDLKLGY